MSEDGDDDPPPGGSTTGGASTSATASSAVPTPHPEDGTAATAAAAAAATAAATDTGTSDAASGAAGATGGNSADGADILNTRNSSYAKRPSIGKAANKTGLSRVDKQQMAREQDDAIRVTAAKAVQIMEAAALIVSNPDADLPSLEDLLAELQEVHEELRHLPRNAMTLRDKGSADNLIRTRLAELNVAVRMATKKKERAEAAAGLNGGGTVEQRLRRLSETVAAPGRPLGSGSGAASAGEDGGHVSGVDAGRSRSYSTPAYDDDDNPYVGRPDKLQPSYWASFPRPWNVQPVKRAEIKAGDILKITAPSLPKFSGYQEEYMPWRSAFLPCVHSAPIDISLKIMLFLGTLEPRTYRLREIKKGFIANEEGYRSAISLLESKFGGDDNLLITRQQALMNLPQLKEGDYFTLELLQIRLHTFLLEWGNSAAGSVEVDSLAFFHVLMRKIDPPFARQYHDWLRRNREHKGLQSLHDWVEQQLDDHHSVEKYKEAQWGGGVQTRRPPLPPPQRGGGGNRGGGRWIPGGHLDRAPAQQQHPQRALCASGWEEVEEDFDAEDAPDQHLLVGAQHGKVDPKLCTLCQEHHGLGRCDKFRALQPQERRNLLARQGRCYVCFQPGHNVRDCRLKLTCAKCGRSHHVLLHGAQWEGGARRAPDAGGERQNVLLVGGGDEELEDQEAEAEDPEGALETVLYGFKSSGRSPRVSLRTVGIWVGHATSGREEYVNALLDDGCTSSALLSEELAGALQLTGRLANVVTEGVGGKTVAGPSLFTQIRIRSHDGQVVRVIPAQVLDRPAGTYQPVDWEEAKEAHPHLTATKFPPVSRSWGGIHLLLGNGNPYLMSSRAEVGRGEDLPRARLTPLGWTAIGPISPTAAQSVRPSPPSTALMAAAAREGEIRLGSPHSEVSLFARTAATDRSLHKLVRRMWEVEELDEREELSPEEQYLLGLMEKKGTREGKQFVLPCTWKPGGSRPPSNYGGALGRLESLERSKYFRDEKVKAAYAAGVEELKDEGFVFTLPREEAKHYLAHFPILKPSSLTTSLRIVMDCSVALNQHLLSGPKLMNDVVSVLLRFRSKLVAFTGDVSKMFFRIKLLPEDKPYHCFLWRNSPQEAPTTYCFNVHVFGNTGSPFVAIYAVREQARLHSEVFPEAAETISRSALVDDILDSEDSVEEAKRVLTDVRALFANMGMEVRKCSSSHSAVLEDLPAEVKAQEMLEVTKTCAKSDGLEGLKTLGIRYDANTDLFSFRMGDHNCDYWTKRKILRVFPQLFDPLGLLLPYALTARCIFSSVAREVQNWDEKLDPGRLERWRRWVEQLRHLDRVKIPRCVKTSIEVRNCCLHLFADASGQAYAACAYLYTEDGSGNRTVRLVMARGKVAPATTSSIPRLELLGAELAVSLASTVKEHLKVPDLDTCYWTDSLNVLFWLRNSQHRLQTFVQNRVSRIRRSSEVQDWRWVPTAANPADLPTRGKSPSELAESSLWWEGPAFLRKPRTAWPTASRLAPSSEALKELKKVEQAFVGVGETEQVRDILPYPRCGTWKKLVAVARLLLSWKTLALEKRRPDRQEVERLMLRQIQAGHLPGAAEKRSGPLFRHLPLFLDEEKLLRGKTRLSNVPALPRDLREPLFLPRDHPAVPLLVRHVHEEALRHGGGVNHTLSKIREKFWLPQGRRVVFNALNGCVPCRRRGARPSRPPQAPLPAFRVPHPEEEKIVFDNVGVDCAGPYRIKRGRSIELHYFLLATCAHTRAVRLEWLSALSTDSFLQAWSRLSAKGVNPRLIFSDNGTNFVGADKLKEKLWTVLRADKGRLESALPLLSWKFNPPYASHYGGAFERLIGAAKRSLYHVLPDTLTLTLEQFVTALSIVEEILNSRPLAYVGGEGEEMGLTPSHFLMGGGSSHLYRIPGGEGVALARRWIQVQELGDLFWRKLQKEIVPHLQAETQRHRGCHRNLQPGDVVVFLHPVQRARWPLARVVEVHPGSDGRVRTLVLAVPGAYLQKDKTQYFKRDVSSVALLLPAAKA